MLRLIVNPEHPEPRKIAHAIEPLGRGGVIAYPTDTVYALGCDYADRRAVEKLYSLKGMTAKQPLAFLLPDLGEIARFGLVSNAAYRLMRRLVPGPYTFILEATREVPRPLLLERNRRRSVGVRVPDCAITQALLRAWGRPILSSSALDAEHVGIGDADEVKARYGAGLDVLVDGGPTGIEVSTVLSLIGDEIEVIREGKGAVPDVA
jgi:tRNA threonylcarbamoyl adenosine modification protein (Sua5/YciO/YrdC/YwlC family)